MTVTRMSVAALAICLVGCRGDDTERAPDVEQLPDVVQPDVADPETSEDIDDSGEPDAPDDTVTETSPDTVPETVADTAIEETEVDGLVDATADVALDPDSVEALWGPTRVAFDPRCARCERAALLRSGPRGLAFAVCRRHKACTVSSRHERRSPARIRDADVRLRRRTLP